MPTILVVDDEPQAADALGALFGRLGHHVVQAATTDEAIEAYERLRPDLVALDLHLADLDGGQLLERLRAEHAVVVLVAERAFHEARRHLRARRGSTRVAAILGDSPAVGVLEQQIERIAASDATPALLLGEDGTGKGRLAELLHLLGRRAGGPFVSIRCAGVAAAELERELFGVPVDADHSGQPGAVDIAAGGTIYLDDVTALDRPLQRRLLEYLEPEGRAAVDVPRLPSRHARVIAGTARDLVAEVRAGRFLEDLYYRLSATSVHLPPLRARAREDVVNLISHVVSELHRELPDAPTELSDGALEHCLRHSWPGNLRELRNVLERAMILARGAPRLATEHLPAELRGTADPAARHTPRTLADVERAHIERTLRAHNANRTRSARELGISRATLINKIKAYRLDDAPLGGRSGRSDDTIATEAAGELA